MSSERKTVKLLSFAAIVALVLCIVSGVQQLGAFGSGQDADLTALGMSGTTCHLLIGVLCFVSAAACLAYAVTGIRGANTPRKIAPHRTTSIVTGALGLVELVGTYLVNSEALTSLTMLGALVLLMLGIAGFTFAGRVIEATER